MPHKNVHVAKFRVLITAPTNTLYAPTIFSAQEVADEADEVDVAELMKLK